MITVVGHQGAPSEGEPGNTIESFQRAIKIGVNAIECDVHLSRDGELIVIHDHDLSRITDGSGDVREFPLKKLRELTVGGKSKIPTLQEVLKLKVLVFIELKSSHNNEAYRGLARKASELLKYLKKNNAVFLSFNPEYLRELNHPNIKKMLLSKKFPALESLKDLGLCGLAIEYQGLTKEGVELAHEKGLKIFAWTVDREPDIKKMIEIGADFICSNNPRLVMEIMKK